MTETFASGDRPSLTSMLVSRLESHASQQVGIARITAEVFKTEPPCSKPQQAAALLEVLFEPGERLVVIADTGIHTG